METWNILLENLNLVEHDHYFLNESTHPTAAIYAMLLAFGDHEGLETRSRAEVGRGGELNCDDKVV